VKIEFTLVDDAGNRYQGVADLKAVVSASKDLKPLPAGTIDPEGLPARLLALRETGFFREPRTALEVHQELRKTYVCLPNRVQMALLRLQKRRELRKAEKRDRDRAEVAYVW
jgi:hypothetical protein